MYRAARWLGLALAAGLPLAAVIVLVGDAPYWLDSPEFVGAAFALQPAHPPGHPLYVLLGRAMLLVPLGSAAFRLNLMGGLLASGALACAYASGLDVLERGFGARHPIGPLVPAMACLVVGTSPAWIHQAVYAEVYALQAFLLALAILFAVRAFLPGDGRDRLLVGCAFVIGLSLANHHLTAFLLVPGLVAAVTMSMLETRGRPARLVVMGGIMAVAALLTYALVPVRGSVEPSMILGRVENVSDFLWLVSAKVYQKSLSGGLGGSDASGVLFIVAEQVGIVACILGLGGLYLAIRTAGTRAAGVLVGVSAAVVLAGRVMLRFDRTNPDVTGYLLVVLVIVVISLAALAGALQGMTRGSSWLRAAAPGAVAAALAFQAVMGSGPLRELLERGDGVDRAQFETREFGVARLPAGSVAVTTLYATSFLTWYGRIVEGERPDVRHVPLPFTGYRGEASVIVERWPELAPIVRGFLVAGALPASEVASLSQDRPVFVEPDPLLGREHMQYLEPAGIFMSFRPEPVAQSDVYAAADESGDRIDGLLGLGPDVLGEPQTKRYVLWWLYNRLLVLARLGYTHGAVRTADQALGLVPGVPEIVRLRERLVAKPGPVDDPSPYLPPLDRTGGGV